MSIDYIEIAPFDNLLVYKKGYTSEFASKIISDKKLGGLRIFSILKDDKLENIDFLTDYDFLENLDITSSKDFDFSCLSELINLKKLSINVGGNNKLDLSSIEKLEYLTINWRKGITGLDNCTSLSSLCLIEFKEIDLTKFSKLTSLIDIRIKTSSIETLKGVEDLSNLQTLYLGNCKKLSSIKSINRLPKLHSLELNKCMKVADYNDLTTLPNLQRLSLVDCGRVETIKFAETFPLLSNLSLLGNTVINDGNLIPAKRIKNIEHKHFDHYNIKLENPSYNQTIKDNLQKIKDLFR